MWYADILHLFKNPFFFFAKRSLCPSHAHFPVLNLVVLDLLVSFLFVSFSPFTPRLSGPEKVASELFAFCCVHSLLVPWKKQDWELRLPTTLGINQVQVNVHYQNLVLSKLGRLAQTVGAYPFASHASDKNLVCDLFYRAHHKIPSVFSSAPFRQ